MFHLPRPRGWFIDPGPRGQWSYACICPVCLKTWLVIGEPGFHLLSIGCIDCAYGEEYARHRGVSRWDIPGSIIERLECYINTTLTRRIPDDRDIITILSPAMIQYELEATLRYFERFLLKETSYVYQDEDLSDDHQNSPD